MSEFITKYFELDTWKYFAAGKIKFGSLEEYGKEENCLAMGAKFDALEGVALESASVQSLGQSQYINIPGVIENFWGQGNTIIIPEIQIKYSEWVFCASRGKYERSSHMEMLNGSGDYLGNEKLHGYCVIDLMKLMLALKIALANEASLFKRCHRFDCRSVMYSKKIYRYEPDADIYSDMNARSAPSLRMRPMPRCNIASTPWRRSQLGCRASRRMVRSLMTRPNAGWPIGWWTDLVSALAG